MEYEYKQAQVDGICLAYVEQGHGEPVLFVHGAGPGDLRTWGVQIEPFSEPYHGIAYSHRYHYPNAWVSGVPGRAPGLAPGGSHWEMLQTADIHWTSVCAGCRGRIASHAIGSVSLRAGQFPPA